jgi:hypothetical protein
MAKIVGILFVRRRRATVALRKIIEVIRIGNLHDKPGFRSRFPPLWSHACWPPLPGNSRRVRMKYFWDDRTYTCQSRFRRRGPIIYPTDIDNSSLWWGTIRPSETRLVVFYGPFNALNSVRSGTIPFSAAIFVCNLEGNLSTVGV